MGVRVQILIAFNREVISGSNDSDIRHFDMVANTCTVYRHHTQKVRTYVVYVRGRDVYERGTFTRAGRLRERDALRERDVYESVTLRWRQDHEKWAIFSYCHGEQARKLKNWPCFMKFRATIAPP